MKAVAALEHQLPPTPSLPDPAILGRLQLRLSAARGSGGGDSQFPWPPNGPTAPGWVLSWRHCLEKLQERLGQGAGRGDSRVPALPSPWQFLSLMSSL